MLYLAVALAVFALIAGVLGFVGLGGYSALAAQGLMFVFLALFAVTLLFGGKRGVAL